jgi:SSS family solute:Na+ symporter
MYATRDVATAKKAWYLAGLLEWPAMAFLGTLLGMCARVLYPESDPEMGLPILIKSVLPIGVVGIVLAVYFSAIMSTADSCLLASVGHLITDLYHKHVAPSASDHKLLRLSRVLTVVVGIASTAIALYLPTVLDAVLLSYSFMVSGLFVPTILGLLWPGATATGALASMLAGGSAAVIFNLFPNLRPHGLATVDPTWLAAGIALVVMVTISTVTRKNRT